MDLSACVGGPLMYKYTVPLLPFSLRQCHVAATSPRTTAPSSRQPTRRSTPTQPTAPGLSPSLRASASSSTSPCCKFTGRMTSSPSGKTQTLHYSYCTAPKKRTVRWGYPIKSLLRFHESMSSCNFIFPILQLLQFSVCSVPCSHLWRLTGIE